MLIVVGFALFFFIGISAMLARALAATGTERSRVLEVAEAQARGDARAVLHATPACARQPACVAATTTFVDTLKRGGEVEILQYTPSVQLPLTRVTGTGRVAWRAGSNSPVVQCVRVRRDGPLSGANVELLSISAPIGNDDACP